MSSTINQQTWEALNTINLEVQENEKGIKRGEARVAEVNHVHGKQKVAKDVILPSAGDGHMESLSKGKKGEAKPTLPSPKTHFAGLKGDDSDEGGTAQDGRTLSLIAVIGAAMVIQAKSNSSFWSTLWKQASESMMIEVKFAPIIGTAIKASYDAQANATKAQADMQKQDGIISLMAFGGALATAGYAEWSEGMEEGEPPKDVNFSDEAENAENENAENEQLLNKLDDSDDSVQKSEKKNLINNENPTWKKRLTRVGKGVKDFGGLTMKRFGSVLGRGVMASQMAQGFTQGVTGLINSKYQGQIALKQEQQGQADAISKESEQYSQFYGQAFSRSDGLTQGTQQNIDYAMNILKSSVDTITQTVRGMFQG